MVITMPTKKQIPPLLPEDTLFFQKFYEEFKGLLFYLARQYEPSQPGCEDLVQDSLLRLLRNLPAIKPLSKNKAAKYIALTVKSAFLDREKQRRGEMEFTPDDAFWEMLQEKESSLYPQDHTAQIRMELTELKQSLSPRDWLVLEGKYILGYSHQELADMIGVTPDSIRMILYRARTKAKSILLGDNNGGGCNG